MSRELVSVTHIAEPVWEVSGLNTSVYTPVVGRVFWLRTALDPLQELDVATVVPSDFTIDRDKSSNTRRTLPFATRALSPPGPPGR